MTVLAERYELLEPIGSGGMAQVHAAYDRVLQRRVAVKLIHESQVQDPVSRERFTREAQLAAGLQHPNTVAVFDVGEHDDRPFIVMELIEGQSLADRLRDQGRLPVEDVVAIGGAVLAGLGAAHECGLVHRDVKPSNILLPAGGGVKLADFGIATALADAASRLTGTGQVLGTPRYLAPECVAGHRATAASDLYSLGAVLYECLTGRAPFEAPTPVAVAVAHQRERVPSLLSAAPQVPEPVAAVVEQALAKDPNDRFSDADAMREALLAAATMGVMPTVAMPATARADTTQEMPTPGEARRTWPLVLLALGVVAVLVIVGILMAQDGDPDTAAERVEEAPGEEVPGEEVPGEEEPAADEPADTDEAPTDLDALIDRLAVDPAAAGEKGDDLLDDLRDLRADPDDAEARDLIEEIADWMAEGELDAEFGRLAVTVLEQESRPESPDLHDVSRLFAEVAMTMPAWGDKGEDLLSDLADLLGIGPPGQRIQQVRSMQEELEQWIAEGEIDAARAQEALAVLQPLLPVN